MKSKTHLLKKALWLKNLFLTACLILVAMPVLSQTRTVTGTVTDTSGDALIGVSILVQGTSNGVVTNLDGKYTLTNVPENGTLTFSYIGMLPQDIKSERTFGYQCDIERGFTAVGRNYRNRLWCCKGQRPDGSHYRS